ncbi:MAG: NAD(P)-dependent oxidoreductase [Candidatus Latescibacterota bacterium]|nr:NAD(P)-dependent oxidoreductase [Candidatus Latescibacterota bacterium]
MTDVVGFIGLGSMGQGMATNLLRKNFDVHVYDVRREARENLVKHGATVAENLLSVGASCKQVVLSLPDVHVVSEVLFGDNSLAEVMEPGGIIVDCGTSHPQETIEISHKLAERDLIFLDAPVTGMETRASEGTLTIMVGGETAAFERLRPVLEAMGSLILHMGPSGSGQLTKMSNNVLYNISVAAMAEMLTLTTCMGLDPDKVRQAVGNGSGQSFGFDYFSERVLGREFGEGYPMASAFKDMRAVMEKANEFHAPLPVTSGAMQTYRNALADGYGAESKGAMIKVWERALGVKVSAQETS